jgi:hypothetical protein
MKKIFLLPLWLLLWPMTLGWSADFAPLDFQPIPDIDLGFLLVQPKLPWGNDPFLKNPGFAEAKTAEEKFVLVGIAWSEDEPMAVINGRAMVEGDQIGTRTIATIGKNYVLLEKGESSIELVLPPSPADSRSPSSEDDENDKEDQE